MNSFPVLPPDLISWNQWLYTESLYIFCLVVFIYALYRLQQTPYSAEEPAPATGTVMLGHLVRHISRSGSIDAPKWHSPARPRIPMGLLVIRARITPWKIVARDALVITCLTVLIIAPWTYRNYRVAHTFILVSTGTGEALNGAYNDQLVCCDAAVRGMWRPPKGAVNHDKLNYRPANDKADTLRALNWMRTHSRDTLYLLGLHFMNTWRWWAKRE